MEHDSIFLSQILISPAELFYGLENKKQMKNMHSGAVDGCSKFIQFFFLTRTEAKRLLEAIDI